MELIWRKKMAAKVPELYSKWSVRAAWLCLALILWIAMPRYRNNSGDRVRLLYVDREGNTQRSPISHWLLSLLLPEEEIVNVGVKGIEYTAPLIRMTGLGNTFIEQAQSDINAGKIGNFFKPDKRLGFNNPSPLSMIFSPFWTMPWVGETVASSLARNSSVLAVSSARLMAQS